MDKVNLKDEWQVVDRIGGGGFGEVFRVTSSGQEDRALKVVPKAPGAERELLFVDLGEARNVIPILEFGEAADSWLLLMPLAEGSLRDRLESSSPLPLDQALSVSIDVCTALADLADSVVHRDIKPENVLLLNNKWCLADFGIARYAEATTDEQTKKYALTAAYCAPERWRLERATPASDVYSVGIMMYELVAGRLPFQGSDISEFREKHLHAQPPSLEGTPPAVGAICEECLYKAPGARPTAANLVARLDRAITKATSVDRSKLAAANLAEVQRRAEAERDQSRENSEQERRSSLYLAARSGYPRIVSELVAEISQDAAAAQVVQKGGYGKEIRLGQATLTFSEFSQVRRPDPWNWQAPALDVIAYGSLTLSIPADTYGYSGRGHSLWFCDAKEAGSYGWFETAFMISPMIPSQSSVNPFPLAPGEESAKALGTGLAEYQLAWPFERLEPDGLREFIERWISWFADASAGNLYSPRSMPEKPVHDSCRRR